MTPWRSLLLALCLLATAGSAAAGFIPSKCYGIADALGHASTSSYNAAGQKSSDTDELSNATSYAYDAAGRLITTTLPSTAATTYAWNEVGQLLSQTDARGHTTKYGYDLAGRRISRTIADGSTEQLAYAADGKLTARQYFDGSKVQYTCTGYAKEYAKDKRLKSYVLYIPVLSSAKSKLIDTKRKIFKEPLQNLSKAFL